MPDDRGQEGEAFASKSARKRDMTARQALGERLCELTPAQLEAIPITEPALHEAIIQARRITARGGRRRHLQYIGKLMRSIDPAPLEAALAQLHQQRAAATEAQHETEALRDQLLARGDAALPEVLARYPHGNSSAISASCAQGSSESVAPPVAADSVSAPGRVAASPFSGRALARSSKMRRSSTSGLPRGPATS
jgi:ribosome-associated protein